MLPSEAQPINIRNLPVGAQLRVAMRAGRQIDQDHTGFAQSVGKPRMSRSYSRHTFYAFLLQNDPANGTLTMSIQGYPSQNMTFSAKIKYGDISILQRVVPSGRPVVENTPKSHPGSAGLGTRYAQLFQQPYLVRVLF